MNITARKDSYSRDIDYSQLGVPSVIRYVVDAPVGPFHQLILLPAKGVDDGLVRRLDHELEGLPMDVGRTDCRFGDCVAANGAVRLRSSEPARNQRGILTAQGVTV